MLNFISARRAKTPSGLFEREDDFQPPPKQRFEIRQ
jgi:hypothetical protein